MAMVDGHTRRKYDRKVIQTQSTSGNDVIVRRLKGGVLKRVEDHGSYQSSVPGVVLRRGHEVSPPCGNLRASKNLWSFLPLRMWMRSFWLNSS